MSKVADGSTDWIDPLIHAPARLQIVMQLFVVEATDATFLLHRTGLTWGNLSSHLSKLEEAPADLAIVDLLLPGINGLELAEAIRMLDPGTPVILITAYGSAAFEGMASHPAIAHYVHKPFSLDRLLSLVHECVPPQPTPDEGG